MITPEKHREYNLTGHYDKCACGIMKAKTSKRCWGCWKLSNVKTPRTDCCSCGNEKQKRSLVCSSCSCVNRVKKFCKYGHDVSIHGRDCDGRCKKCKSTRKRDFRLRLYGLDSVAYNSLFDAQAGRCAVCKRHQSELPTPLHIDHDHRTNVVRGLLCNGCNSRVVVVVEEFGHLIDPARDYLRNPPYCGGGIVSKTTIRLYGKKPR